MHKFQVINKFQLIYSRIVYYTHKTFPNTLFSFNAV